MKRLFLIAMFCLLAVPAMAQEVQTLFAGDVRHGGFGAPVLRLSTFDNDAALFVGGRGGWIVNANPSHAFVIGGGGYGLVTNHRLEGLFLDQEPLYLVFGYGGGEIGYVNNSHRLVHFSIQTLIGAGGVSHRTSWTHMGHHGGYSFASSPAFVAEPGIDVVVNLTNFMRVTAGASYRFVSGVNLEGVRGADLSSPSAVFSIKFGSF